MKSLKLNNKGFTMIELLMTIMIISVLGAVAVPQFLDFRKEARVAVLQQNLAAIRTGVQNQVQQAILRCNKSKEELLSGSGFGNALEQNSIISGVCTGAEITDVASRSFVDVSDANLAKNSSAFFFILVHMFLVGY